MAKNLSYQTKNLKQKAVYWAATSTNNNFGDPKLSAPVEIDSRWEFTNGEITDENGNTIGYEGKVAVDREIAVNSILWKGEQRDLSSPPTNLKSVVAYKEIPDLKGRRFRRIAYVIRHNNTLPDLA